MQRHNNLVLLAGCTLLLVGAGALAQQPIGNANGCSSKPLSKAEAHDTMVALASVLDPSGQLAKHILASHPRPGEHKEHGVGSDPLIVAASEPEPVIKRSPVEEEKAATAGPSANATAATTSALDAIKAMVMASSPASGSTPTTAAPVVAAKSEQAPSAPVNASTTPAPKAAETTAASNVTVNVFLQLAPDAKTDELVSVTLRSPSTL